jgi:hypothetical protein
MTEGTKPAFYDPDGEVIRRRELAEKRQQGERCRDIEQATLEEAERSIFG